MDRMTHTHTQQAKKERREKEILGWTDRLTGENEHRVHHQHNTPPHTTTTASPTHTHTQNDQNATKLNMSELFRMYVYVCNIECELIMVKW